jgi:hypothetical protein
MGIIAGIFIFIGLAVLLAVTFYFIPLGIVFVAEYFGHDMPFGVALVIWLLLSAVASLFKSGVQVSSK